MSSNVGKRINPHTLGLYNSLDLIKPRKVTQLECFINIDIGFFHQKINNLYHGQLMLHTLQQLSMKISKGESKEIRMLYKFYRYLKACPPVKKIDSDCVNPDIGADAGGFTCKDKETYGWLCDYNTEHSCQCCACDKSKCENPIRVVQLSSSRCCTGIR